MQTDSSTSSTSEIFESIAQLRDEIRLKMHLATLDATQKWEKLEEQVESFEHQIRGEGGSVANATVTLARDLKRSLMDFRDRLSSH